jgi:predicted phosphodiesterase
MTSLRLGILTDLHRTTNPQESHQFHNEYDFEGHCSRVQRALAWFAEEAIDALLLCGDLTHTGELAAMSSVLGECCAGLQAPVIAVSGNHDVSQNEDLLARGIERSADSRLLAADPCGEMISGVRVAGLQLIPTCGYDRSRLRDLPALEEWGEEPVVLLSHLPLLSRAEAVAGLGMPYPGDLVDREQAAALLQTRSAATIVVSGHAHVRDVDSEGPVLQLLQAAMIEPPFEATVIDVGADVDGSVLVIRRTHRTSDRRAMNEPTLTEPVGAWRFADGVWSAVAAESLDPQDTPVGDPIA